jgi:hypothetical protein
LSVLDQKARIVREANQFQYAGAITAKEQFFDREEELTDAVVVCEQILNGGTGGVLVLGGRGTGKTSFLYELERRLVERKIATGKISLDLSMVREDGEPRFFKLILDDLTNAAEAAELINKETATKVRQILQGVITKVESLEFSAFGLGVVAKAAQGEHQAALPYAILRDGLKDLYRILRPRENGRKPGAILMLDEGDNLTENKVLLQVLRNVFQEVRGMGLVIAGTSRLLSGVSEVFSPIPRFFRKIDLGPFPTDEDVRLALSKPVERAKVDLLSRGIHLDVKMYEFIDRVIDLSGRMPFDFNVLSYFAYDLASKRLAWKDDVAVLYLRLDIDVLEQAIGQLRGTRDYVPFLDSLTDYDRRVLGLLSRCPFGASVDELNALLVLDRAGENLRSLTTDQIISLLSEFETQKEETEASVGKVMTLGEKYSIKALNPELAKKAVFRVEDQWVNAYFRYSDLSLTVVNLEYGLISADSGIIMLSHGDPVSSILNSAFLHRIMGHLADWLPFKTNSSPNDGLKLYSETGKLLNASFARMADGKTWHVAYHLKPETSTDVFKPDMKRLLVKLESLGLVKNPSVKERAGKRPWA